MHNQHRSPDPTKIERATATSTVALILFFPIPLTVVACDSLCDSLFSLTLDCCCLCYIAVHTFFYECRCMSDGELIQFVCQVYNLIQLISSSHLA